MIAIALVAIGAVLWLGTLVTTLRDRKMSRATRVITMAILAAAVPVVLLYWWRG